MSHRDSFSAWHRFYKLCSSPDISSAGVSIVILTEVAIVSNLYHRIILIYPFSKSSCPVALQLYTDLTLPSKKSEHKPCQQMPATG